MTTETMTREERSDRLDEFAQMQMADQNEPTVPALLQPAALPQIIGAQEIARLRDETMVLQKIRVLAAAAGQDWYYRYPVRNRRTGQTDWIEGPSIKLTNDVARLYGNNHVDCRAEDLGSVIMFYARFLDLETGYALTRPFQQRKGASKLGGTDDARRDDATFQIGVSKAQRNVVVNALQTFVDFAFEEAKHALVDKIGRDIDTWRERVATRLGAKIDLARVELVIGRPVPMWTAPDIAKVVAMGKAVEEGMATWDESFPPLVNKVPQPDEALDTFAEENGAAGPGSVEASSVSEADPSPPATAPADDAAPDQAEIARRLQRSAIDICIRMAGNSQLTDQEKLEQLDNIGPSLDGCTPAFIKTITKTAADVVAGKIKAADARRYLEGMVK